MSARVTLRRARRSDVLLVEPWYQEAALAVDGGSIPDDDPDLAGRLEGGGLWVITRVGDPSPIGLLEGVTDWPARGWVTIEWVALAAGQRGWGYGSEAVRLFEAKQRRSQFLAEIDPRNGLALYFWLRLGYRPARSEEVFWRGQDKDSIIAMIRAGLDQESRK